MSRAFVTFALCKGGSEAACKSLRFIILKDYSDFHNNSFVKKLNMNNLPYSLTITMIINKQVLITFTVTLKTKRYIPIHKKS